MNTFAKHEYSITSDRGCYQVGSDVSILSDIYDEKNNIVIWQRNIEEISNSALKILYRKPNLEISKIVSGQNISSTLIEEIGDDISFNIFFDDVALLVDIFCTLFQLNEVGIRLARIDKAMCPRFHVDNVPCRLVTTYDGIATEWLSHPDADRSKLGTGNLGKSDEESGIYKTKDQIKYLNKGDVALLKGESWEGNEGAGLVHRSPNINKDEPRILLTLDFV